MDIAEPQNKNIVIQFIKLRDQIMYNIDTLGNNKSDIYRLRQTNNIINILKKYPDIIKSGDQLEDIKGIGKGTMNRIDEIIKTGHLQEVKGTKQKYEKYITELESVIGIGRKKAYELIKNYDIKSVDELKKAVKNKEIDVTYKIKLGLKYYNKYQEKVPNEEIQQIDKYFDKVIKKIDEDLTYVICGSYRRGKPTSHDIDVLLVHKNVKTKRQIKLSTNYLHKVVDYLKKDKFILDDIDPNYMVKYMGFCKYKKYPIRRIDIMYFPYDSYYPALLHLTGSGEFNRKMREVAKTLGYMLNQYGLYRVKTDDQGKELYVKVKIKSEKELFDKLNMEYLEPHER